MHKARIATVAACVTAAAGAALAAAPAAVSAAPAQPAAAHVTIRPGAIRLPHAAAAAPPTTAQCEKSYGIACFTPDQLRAAYNLNALYKKGAAGQGETIMIVDSFGSPTIKADLAAFDRAFGYPAPPKFTVIAPAGKIPKFDPFDSDMAGWAGETTLDVEYAHALAPQAGILLVETPVPETEGTAGFPQIVKAEEYALAHYRVAVISQSFSATEETFPKVKVPAALRAAYQDAYRRKVTVLAASGDAGATDYKTDMKDYYPSRVTSWPDSDPLVTGVGGTQLKPSGAGYKSVAWNDTYDQAWNLYASGSTSPSPVSSGGGKSVFFARPSWQNSVKGVAGARRGVPDISMSAACDGAVSTYSSYDPGDAGWSLTCGTSEATPEFAAVVAIAAQVAGHGLGDINPGLYSLETRHAAGLVDVTAGSNTVSYSTLSGQTVKVTGFPAAKGYDLVTGVGTVNAASFAYELAGKGK